jgi:hypothetical protein
LKLDLETNVLCQTFLTDERGFAAVPVAVGAAPFAVHGLDSVAAVEVVVFAIALGIARDDCRNVRHDECLTLCPAQIGSVDQQRVSLDKSGGAVGLYLLGPFLEGFLWGAFDAGLEFPSRALRSMMPGGAKAQRAAALGECALHVSVGASSCRGDKSPCLGFATSGTRDLFTMAQDPDARRILAH